jgi:hypothetical protein
VQSPTPSWRFKSKRKLVDAMVEAMQQKAPSLDPPYLADDVAMSFDMLCSPTGKMLVFMLILNLSPPKNSQTMGTFLAVYRR